MMTTEKYQPVKLDYQATLDKAMQREGFKEAWDALEDEYATLKVFIEARKSAGLTQEEIAQKMGTTKSAVSRLEASFGSEKHSPSITTLKKYAAACGRTLTFSLKEQNI